MSERERERRLANVYDCEHQTSELLHTRLHAQHKLTHTHTHSHKHICLIDRSFVRFSRSDQSETFRPESLLNYTYFTNKDEIVQYRSSCATLIGLVSCAHFESIQLAHIGFVMFDAIKGSQKKWLDLSGLTFNNQNNAYTIDR